MKIGIVGAGFVGSTAAYALALEGIGQEIILVDINEALARAQAEDILHATPYTNAIRIGAGGFESLSDASVIILACGVNQQEGESRLHLLERNAAIFREVVGRLVVVAPRAVLVVASNPVDVITQITLGVAEYPAHRVIGSGTILDTARFRSLVGQHMRVSPRSVHAYVLGEHGDSEVLIWSSAHLGGVPLLDFAKQIGRPITDEIRHTIDDGVRHAAGRIIAGKGATYYGIASGLARIVRAIRDDEGAVLTVSGRCSSAHPDVAGVCLSVPRIIGAGGIAQEIWPALSAREHEELVGSAEIIKNAAAQVGC
ncbi:MAG: L-lactate dehydrogenase [Desulfofustis sp. PB-SRB1]|jgi:L-lactate dehydrogenase|nr:L-lactate dehydrogenase [Desulfofustis sp. PB-SRB1]